ncbi:TPA: hypothetical protein ACXENI_003916 [Acinetobacter baumannii]
MDNEPKKDLEFIQPHAEKDEYKANTDTEIIDYQPLVVDLSKLPE